MEQTTGSDETDLKLKSPTQRILEGYPIFYSKSFPELTDSNSARTECTIIDNTSRKKLQPNELASLCERVFLFKINNHFLK